MFVIHLANATSDNQLIDELNIEDLDFEDFNNRIEWINNVN